MPKLIDVSSGDVVLNNLEIADTFWKRFIGLQFRASLPHDTGVLLSPCSSLHTCFMRFPIDVIMLDQRNVVIGVLKSVRPWRVAFCFRKTKHVIEVNAGSVEVAIGTSLEWR